MSEREESIDHVGTDEPRCTCNEEFHDHRRPT
jgi:hypothetical protein